MCHYNYVSFVVSLSYLFLGSISPQSEHDAAQFVRHRGLILFISMQGKCIRLSDKTIETEKKIKQCEFIRDTEPFKEYIATDLDR